MTSGKLISYFIFFIVWLQPVKGQNYTQDILMPGCTLKICGITNVNSFNLTCLASSNTIKIYPVVTLSGIQNLQEYKVDLNLPVNSFEADNPGIKNDFIDLVKGKSFPTMHIYITHFNMSTSAKCDKDSCANVEITIGGVNRNYSVKFHTTNNAKEIVTSGHEKLNIRDFNLEPPKKFFGLIQVKETIDIDFRLYLTLPSVNNVITYRTP